MFTSGLISLIALINHSVSIFSVVTFTTGSFCSGILIPFTTSITSSHLDSIFLLIASIPPCIHGIADIYGFHPTAISDTDLFR
jgi:uncharacterized membrane protein